MSTDPENDQNKKEATNFAKYSGIAIQLLVTIGVFAFIGYKIDTHKGNEKLIFTAILGVLGVAVSLYQVVRSLKRNS